MFTLADLPFAKDALSPIINSQTLEIHHGKHHQAYVNKLNELIENTDLANLSLEEIIQKAEFWPIFNNAAQVWNHTFYWNSLRPAKDNNLPTGDLANTIINQRGSFENFKQKFTTNAINNFWSGWTWLAKTESGELAIINTSNAGCPLRAETVIWNTNKKQYTPLFTIDVREHAYYLDYQNRRPDYMSSIRSLINRDFAENNYN